MFRSVTARLIPGRFVRDERGVSAIEFALLLPLLLTLYLGGVEVSQGVAIDRKVTLTARTVADLVSRVAAVNDADLNNVLAASSAVLAPYPTDKAVVKVSLVKIDKDKKATVEWSKALNGAGRANGEAAPVPAELREASGYPIYYVWGEAEYSYEPVVGYVVTGTMKLDDHIFMRPRLDGKVAKL